MAVKCEVRELASPTRRRKGTYVCRAHGEPLWWEDTHRRDKCPVGFILATDHLEEEIQTAVYVCEDDTPVYVRLQRLSLWRRVLMRVVGLCGQYAPHKRP